MVWGAWFYVVWPVMIACYVTGVLLNGLVVYCKYMSPKAQSLHVNSLSKKFDPMFIVMCLFSIVRATDKISEMVFFATYRSPYNYGDFFQLVGFALSLVSFGLAVSFWMQLLHPTGISKVQKRLIFASHAWHILWNTVFLILFACYYENLTKLSKVVSIYNIVLCVNLFPMAIGFIHQGWSALRVVHHLHDDMSSTTVELGIINKRKRMLRKLAQMFFILGIGLILCILGNLWTIFLYAAPAIAYIVEEILLLGLAAYWIISCLIFFGWKCVRDYYFTPHLDG